MDNIDETVLVCLENIIDELDDNKLAYFNNPAICVDEKLASLNELCKVCDFTEEAVNIL
jgi:hypothetical protein